MSFTCIQTDAKVKYKSISSGNTKSTVYEEMAYFTSIKMILLDYNNSWIHATL